MDVKRLVKKVQVEWKKPKNRNVKKFVIFECLMFITYFILLVIQYVYRHNLEFKLICYSARWAVLIVALFVWWVFYYVRRGK